MANVWTIDKAMIVTMIISMDKTMDIDTIALAWHQSS